MDEKEVDDFFNEMVKKPLKKKKKIETKIKIKTKSEEKNEIKVKKFENSSDLENELMKLLKEFKESEGLICISIIKKIEKLTNEHQVLMNHQSIFPKIYKDLISIFTHKIDVCREISIQIIIKFVKILKNESKMILKFIFPIITSRISKNINQKDEFIENCEEVRLLLIKLLHLISIYFIEEDLEIYCDDHLKNSICESFKDFYKINEEICLTTIEFCQKIRNFKLFSETLIKSLIPNFSNSRSDVRSISLKTLKYLIICGGYDGEKYILKLENIFYNLSMDLNSTVRLELFECIKHWIYNLSELENNLNFILTILFLFLSDELDSIKIESLNLITLLGNKLIKEDEEENKIKFNLIPLKEPFTVDGYPNIKSRRLIKNYSKNLIQKIGDKITQWDISIKMKYIKLLSNVLIFCEEYSILYLKNIFMIILESLIDSPNDLNLKIEIDYCIELISNFINLKSNLKMIFDSFINEGISLTLKDKVLELLELIINKSKVDDLNSFENLKFFVDFKSSTKEIKFFVEFCMNEIVQNIQNEDLKNEYLIFLKEI
eukprot:gene2268-2442_t